MHINDVKRMQEEKEHLMRNEGKHPANYSREEKRLFEQTGKLDPTGIMSDESYIRGMSSDNPERAKLMQQHNLKDDSKNPGVYGSSGKNY